MAGIVVIGAGQAGVALAARLRAMGCTDPIALVGEETVPPYQRPPLSKGYLLGDMGVDRLTLRADGFYADQGIDLHLGQPVTAIDPAARTVTLGDRTLSYDKLALTTGSIARRLPPAMGGNLAGVHAVRTLADVDAMRPEVVAGRRLVVIGGGYIGLEAAAVAAKLGLDVTVIEAAPRILARVASAEAAAFFRNLHTGHGVTVLEGTGLARLLGDTRVTGAELTDGRVIPADLVIAGIGIAPATGLAEAVGLVLDNGIAVDARGRSSDPAIWAAGDCASFPVAGGRMRLESVQNAIEQAEAVAADMLGQGKDYAPMPWFWSDQYDVKLQIAGLGAGADHVVTRQDSGTSFWSFAGDRLLAVEAANDPRAFMVGKRLLEAGRTPTPHAVATAAAVKDLL
ncbi:NAD(P)/FAD-dependent oxidoreductase [Falsirhodobacter halotolerans]|uniref:NAD(P)/FAD-dependent oxidoreductase n=1 Tax=Falsirhodobacter halotolerans TaxID=1146892 RepID=UPI001FD30A23|nr:FAD-dependent oxidoreductase [Falsirhodobacter halotolerans]MCJ8140660.1 FAD-dependent oxidoreductase [Falsirhodobacter halotolerans]